MFPCRPELFRLPVMHRGNNRTRTRNLPKAMGDGMEKTQGTSTLLDTDMLARMCIMGDRREGAPSVPGVRSVG